MLDPGILFWNLWFGLGCFERGGASNQLRVIQYEYGHVVFLISLGQAIVLIPAYYRLYPGAWQYLAVIHPMGVNGFYDSDVTSV